MTKAQAYQVLGLSSSADRSRAELLYRQKCRELRLQMMPGMPVAARQKAQAELARVDAAWQVLQAPNPTRAAARKAANKQTTGPAPVRLTPSRKGQRLGETWVQMTSLLPFSEPVNLLILIMVLVLTLMALLSHL
jgi:curved DNA-binding protein CbpA